MATVDDHRAGLHRPHHGLGDDDRCAAAGHEHRADHEVGVGDGPLDRAAVRGEGHDAALVDLVDPAEPVEVLVEQHDLGLHALRRSTPRSSPTLPAPSTTTRPGARPARRPAARRAHRARARGSAHRPAAPCGPATSLIGASKGSAPVGDLHRLVGDAGDPLGEQRVGDLRVRREVEVGEEHEAGPEVLELLGLWLLDLAARARRVPTRRRRRRRSRHRRRGSRRR